MSSFWSLWIIILTVITVAGITWVLFANRSSDQSETDKTTGHVYDGIEEYDNPLPAWWFNLFVATIVFSIIYLVLYPGMGSFKGVLGWTQINQWQARSDAGEDVFMQQAEPLFAIPAAQLVENHRAIRMGKRLFKSNCSVCHGGDGKGGHAFPNLTDNDWLYGGTEEAIKQSITHGREGAMPPWGAVLGENLNAMTTYVQALSDETQADTITEHEMHNTFEMMCTACHGKDATGNIAMGAPNLTDNIWLYGSGAGEIKMTIEHGRSGKMPAHEKLLNKERIHLITAYVMSLSHVPE